MSRIVPFRGILYNPKRIRDLSRIVAPPYDVITPEEQEDLYRKSPYNVVRLILSRDKGAYEGVGRLFESWQNEGILERDEKPAIYFLSQRFRGRDGAEKRRLGFVALARLEDFASGRIFPHERTMEAPREEQFRLMLACGANLSPIFGLYSEPGQKLNRALEGELRGIPPEIAVRADEGGLCELWRITDPGLIRLVQDEIEEKPLLIADGHHRYEAALAYRDCLRKRRGGFTGREAFNYVMMYLANISDEGLVVLPTHRLVRAFPPMAFQKLEAELQRYFYLEPYPKTLEGRRWFLRALRSGGKKRLIGASFRRDPRYLILRLKNRRIMRRLAQEMSAPLRELDVTILHLLLLEHILGLKPEEKEALIYCQDEEKVLKAVEEDDCQAAFLLNPPRPEEIMAIALSGEKLPQKTTYFYPKLLSGLVINKISPDEEVGDSF